jgi:hypothetical protein
MALLALAEGCDGPGPLTPAEVRWRWQHGSIRRLEVVDGGVRVEVTCPAEHGLVDGQGVTATVVLLTREVREFERRDPLLRRDPFRMVAWRRCQDEADRLTRATPP